tara:strand:+ start:5731 stop:7083 length:1353 start_codon:yes stop_codon:yes gene_type:complete
LIPLSFAQIPQKIHDLKSLTDSSGTVHLFYRIYAEYEGTEYSTDHIYRYNTETGEEELFLEDFYDTRFGFPYSQTINDYEFLNNDIQNFVFITTYCDNECFVTISRNDSLDMMGGLFVTMDYLNVEGPDSGRVYVEAYGKVVIGRNGGRDWPTPNEDNDFEIPDSSKLDFPLISLSPYNDSLMFGRKFFHADGENAFLRSIDKGLTSEFISDTLLPNDIYFDSDSNAVYMIDVLSTPVPKINCEVNICNYGLFTNKHRENADFWELKQIFPSSVNTPSFPEIFTHPTESGMLYVWNADSVLVTEDYGENFEVLLNSDEDITGFSIGDIKEYYTTTSTLYSLENGNSVELFSILVSNEHQIEIPKQNKLLQNYPNPFNPTTTISYQMNRSGQVTIRLYTITGQLVKELLNKYNTSGTYHFQLNGDNLSSGMYILRGRLGENIESKTITLIK